MPSKSASFTVWDCSYRPLGHLGTSCDDLDMLLSYFPKDYSPDGAMICLKKPQTANLEFLNTFYPELLFPRILKAIKHRLYIFCWQVVLISVCWWHTSMSVSQTYLLERKKSILSTLFQRRKSLQTLLLSTFLSFDFSDKLQETWEVSSMTSLTLLSLPH